MDISMVSATNAVYRERLQQAVRVMQDLAANPEGRQFDILVLLEEDEDVLVGCIAGFCALDPWFQQEGLTVDHDEQDSPILSVRLDKFFGTEKPFHAHHYPRIYEAGTDNVAPITIDRAIAALKCAIAELPRRVLRVRIGPMPQLPGDPLPKVHAYFDDGTDAELFEFSAQEPSFTESDFVGLTSSEAMTLRPRRDVGCLPS